MHLTVNVPPFFLCDAAGPCSSRSIKIINGLSGCLLLWTTSCPAAQIANPILSTESLILTEKHTQGETGFAFSLQEAGILNLLYYLL